MAVLSTLLSKRLGTVVAQVNMARMVNIVNMDMVNMVTHTMVIGLGADSVIINNNWLFVVFFSFLWDGHWTMDMLC